MQSVGGQQEPGSSGPVRSASVTPGARPRPALEPAPCRAPSYRLLAGRLVDSMQTAATDTPTTAGVAADQAATLNILR